jgi:type I restriction enzyme S subunit
MRQKYPSYQETHLDWLEEIPSHWSLGKLGVCFSERNEKVSDTDYLPLSVTKNGIVPQMEHVAKTDAGDNRKKVCKNDFVINSRSDRKGSAGVSELDGSVSLISTVLEPRFYLPRFAHHLFRSYNFQEEFYRFGKGIVADLWSTRYAEMKNIVVPLLPMDEQEAIANFLDRETARIDKLIAEKQTFIKLLKEKRQTLISHVVTKGLNPNVKMKDSGIEWIGEVPEHWTVGKIGFRARILNGTTPSKLRADYWDTKDIPWLSSGSVNQYHVTEASDYITHLGMRIK